MATKIENSGDFYQWQITKRSMGERIKHLYNNPLMADVNFLVAEKGEKRESKITVPCHKLVLGLSSPVFFAMFYGELAETGDFIDLPDCDSEGFLEFLRYIYRDEAKLTGNCVMQVLYLAKKYIIPSLTELCRRFLEKHITPQNVLDVLPQVTEIDETHLTSVCWNVVDFHTEEVFISASPSLLDDANSNQMNKRGMATTVMTLFLKNPFIYSLKYSVLYKPSSMGPSHTMACQLGKRSLVEKPFFDSMAIMVLLRDKDSLLKFCLRIRAGCY